MTRTRFRMSEEKQAELKQKRLASRDALTMDYQLGLYVGEYIYFRFLPTLSVDSLKSLNVIKATDEEELECIRLSDLWFRKYNDADKKVAELEEWKALRAYHEILENKYLPKELKCPLPLLKITDENQFKEGLRTALWDTDLCHYKIENNEDIVISEDSSAYFTTITLTR